jgi:ABC-type transport system substrate-binding protein
MRRLDRAPQAAARKVGLNIAETAVDDPEPGFHENYLCGAMCDHTGYCYLEIDNMVDARSAESDLKNRKHKVWAIGKRLTEDDPRSILFYNRAAVTWRPRVRA